MSVPILQSLSASGGGGGAPLPGAWPALADVPLSLIWAVAVLTFGVLLMVCVLMLLRRQGAPDVADLPDVSAARRGQYLQHLSRLLRATRAINSLIVAERDGQQLLQKACHTLTATRGYRLAWIGMVEEESTKVMPAAQAGFENGYLDQVEITWDDSPTGQGPTGRAIRTGEPVVMRDIQTEPSYEPWRQQALERGYRSSAALPLRFRGRVLGALNVYADIKDAFDIEEIGLLQEVADHLAYAYGSIEVEDELRRLKRQLWQAERVQTVFENAPIGMMVTDGEGVVKYANARMAEYLDGGGTPEEMIGRVCILELAMFSSPAVSESVKAVLSDGEPAQFACTAPTADGWTRTLTCRGVPVVEEDEGLVETVWLVE
jgi:GAF domain-containing protein